MCLDRFLSVSGISDLERSDLCAGPSCKRLRGETVGFGLFAFTHIGVRGLIVGGHGALRVAASDNLGR